MTKERNIEMAVSFQSEAKRYYELARKAVDLGYIGSAKRYQHYAAIAADFARMYRERGMKMDRQKAFRIVDELKSGGHYFAAGALAFSCGYGRDYGQHFGMRSTRYYAISDFQRGYDAAKADAIRESEK